MNALSPVSTVYGEVAPEAAAAAKEAAVRIKLRLNRTAADIVEIGRDLIAAKKALGHGKFLPWIEAEFGMSDRHARNFMRVAESFGKSEIIADLPPTVLYALSAPDTPEAVKNEIAEKAKNGESITAATVADLKRKLKAAESQAREARRDSEARESYVNNQITEAKKAGDELAYARDRIREQAEQIAERDAELAQQASEIERLKQDNTLHVYPADPPKTVTEVVAAPKPAARTACLRTVAELIADRFDHDIGEVADLLREGGQYSLAMELEQAVGRQARGGA